MMHWSKMAEIIENHWETHQAVFRHKSEISKDDLAKVFAHLSKSLQGTSNFEMNKIIPSAKKVTVRNPAEPLEFKFLYAKEKNKEGKDKFEIHMELEWNTK